MAAANPATSAPTSGTRPMILMGLMMAGASSVDTLTATLLPITARHFTDNIAFIGWLVAMNRICGFLVQPYAAWKSDSYNGAGGRRRPFLMGGWPAVFLGVALVGALPYVTSTDHRHTLPILAVLFAANLLMQAAVDLCYGCGDTLYGDTFAADELGRANGVRMIVTTICSVAMTSLFVPLAEVNEFWPYAGALLFVAVAFLIARFGLRERVPLRLPPSAPYHPFKPLLELRDPHTRKVALCGASILVVHALTEMLHALFVTETLGLSLTALGGSTAAALVMSFAMPYPVGWLVDRVGPRVVMIAGFVLVALVEFAFVFWVNNLASLTIALVIFKVAWVVVHLPMMPLLFHDTPVERRGAIFAAVQTTRAGAASVAIVVAGELAAFTGSYRICYLLAGIVCVVGLVGALRLTAPKRTAAVPAMA
ncbi:MAG: MFS transporter [Verrucomicrobiota bacterium]